MTTATPPYRIALIGECMIELEGQPQKTFSQNFGGDTLNTAIYMARLGRQTNIQVDYVTALGTDTFSNQMLQVWREEGIGCQHIRQLKDKLPGLYMIELDEQGERSFYYWRNDSAARNCFELPDSDQLLATLTEYDALYLSGISLAILPASSRERLLQAVQKLKANGGRFIFDNNYRPSLWPSADVARSVYADFLALCDIALLTWDDEQQLYGYSASEQVFQRCRKQAIPEVVIKRGSDACRIDLNGQRFQVPARNISNVVDTTAAGDSFGAGYLATRLSGGDPNAAALKGHQLAAAVIQHKGAILPVSQMPTDC